MLTRACYEAFVTVVKRKGATATNSKMMPRQHIDSGSSWRYGAKEVGMSMSCKDGGVLLEYRVPMGRWHGKRGASQGRFGHGANIWYISYNKAFVHRRRLGGYTFEACVFGAVRVVEGSSCSRGNGSGTYRSGSSCSSPVDVRGPQGLRGSTVVVHGRRGSSRTWVFERR